MKKILVVILINLIVVIAGISLANQKGLENKLETVTFADSIFDFPKIPGIPWIPDIPGMPGVSSIIGPIGDVLIDLKKPFDTTLLNSAHPSSSDPIVLLNVWLTPGYNLQPGDRNVVVGKPRTLYTNSDRSFWMKLLLPGALHYYVWYKSSDRVKWDRVDKETGQNLTVTPKTIGTTYYKQISYWIPDGVYPFGSVAYSNVGSIRAYNHENDAKGLKVTADSKYLYNNQDSPVTTFVHGEAQPKEATGDISWSTDDASLATVDPRTGLVTANSNKKSGIVKITGTIANTHMPSVQDSVSIQVGGGLDDITVDDGNPAEFKILGSFNQKPTSITWYKSSSTEDNKVLSGQNDMSYTIPKAKMTDDGSRYNAVITVKDDKSGKVQTIQTNGAVLHVNKNNTSNIKMKSSIFKKDAASENTSLAGIKKNDLITYRAIVESDNTKKGVINLNVPVGMNLDSVKVDTKDINLNSLGNKDSMKYFVSPSDSKELTISIVNIDFSSKSEHIIDITGEFSSTNLSTYKTRFVFMDSDSNKMIEGEPLSWYLGDGLLSLKAHNWQYQAVSSFGKNKLLKRKKMTGNVLDVEDKRTNKNSVQLYLRQKDSFHSDAHILPCEIRYYYHDGHFDKLDNNNGVLVEKSQEGKALESVAWNSTEGPLLYVPAGKIIPGNYSSDLEWSVVQSL